MFFSKITQLHLFTKSLNKACGSIFCLYNNRLQQYFCVFYTHFYCHIRGSTKVLLISISILVMRLFDHYYFFKCSQNSWVNRTMASSVISTFFSTRTNLGLTLYIQSQGCLEMYHTDNFEGNKRIWKKRLSKVKYIKTWKNNHERIHGGDLIWNVNRYTFFMFPT